MTAAVTSMSRSPAPRWMAVALLASLALNLVVVGATVASLWRHRALSELGGPPHAIPNLLSFANSLPEERRKEVWARTEDQRRIVRPLRRDLREAREELLKLLSADDFDAERYQAAQAQLTVVDQKAREAVYKLYAEIAVALTSEERHQFMRWREKRRPQQNLLDEPDHQANQRP
jgi:uncharacterized membrane protein